MLYLASDGARRTGNRRGELASDGARKTFPTAAAARGRGAGKRARSPTTDPAGAVLMTVHCRYAESARECAGWAGSDPRAGPCRR